MYVNGIADIQQLFIQNGSVPTTKVVAPTSKTDALSTLLQTYLPQYSKEISVLTKTEQVQTPAQAAATTAAAAAAKANAPMTTGNMVLIGGAAVGLIGLAVVALRGRGRGRSR